MALRLTSLSTGHFQPARTPSTGVCGFRDKPHLLSSAHRTRSSSLHGTRNGTLPAAADQLWQHSSQISILTFSIPASQRPEVGPSACAVIAADLKSMLRMISSPRPSAVELSPPFKPQARLRGAHPLNGALPRRVGPEESTSACNLHEPKLRSLT